MKEVKNKLKSLFNATSVVIGAFLLVVGVSIGLVVNSGDSFALDTNNMQYGDLNCDGEITSTDMIALARAVRGLITLTPEQKVVADVNNDGKVNAKDEYVLARYMVNYDNMSLPYTEELTDIKYGDINLDGDITSTDSILLAKYIAKTAELNDEQKINADLNYDGKIDDCDKDILAKYLVGTVSLPYVVMATPSNATASNATATNATASNATASNATASNATASNATATNATASNVVTNDNILFLNRIELNTGEAKVGNRVDLTLVVTGTCNYSAKVYFMDFTTDYLFGVDIKDLNTGNPYIVIPDNVPGGKYNVAEVILYGLNSDNTTFTRVFSAINPNADVFADFLGNGTVINITRDSSNVTDINLGSIGLSKSSVKVGEQVNVNIEHKENIFDMTLVFKSDDTDNTFKVYLNRINIKYDGAYFIVPSNVFTGNYHLSQIAVSDGSDTIFYTRGVNLADIPLEIVTNEEKAYVYSNVNFNLDNVKEIFEAPDNAKIVIDASVNSIVSDELFDAIKGTNKQLVINYKGNEIIFNGKDITSPKTIDVDISVFDNITASDDNKVMASMVQDGVIVDLSSNGTLPGKAVYRIYATDEMKNVLGNRKIYLYYYDELNNNFNLVQTNVKLNGNYYELNIDHNSKFILTKNKIDSQYVVKSSSGIVDFQNSDTINLLLIMGGLALILIVIIIILFLKKKKSSTKRK